MTLGDEFARFQSHGKAVRHRFEDAGRHHLLELPDGRPAAGLRRGPLLAELQRLKTPGISAEMPKQDLLDCYGDQLRAVRDEIYPRDSGGHLSQAQTRAAAQFLGAQCHG
jgi:hypothetical protein